MDIKIIKHGVICDGSENIFSFSAWPTVTRLRDGRLAMVCSSFRLHHICPFGKVVICYSSDEGKTWSMPAPIVDTPLDDRDAGICVWGDKVIVTSFNVDNAYNRKWLDRNSDALNDGEKKWFDENLSIKDRAFIKEYLDLVSDEEEEKYLGSYYVVSDDGGYRFGDIKKVPVTAPHGPIALKNGDILYVGCDYYTGEAATSSNLWHTGNRILAMRSSDGENWSEPVEIRLPENDNLTGFYEPHAIELEDGKILVQFRVHEKGVGLTMYQAYSYDGGKTFTVPQPLNVCGAPPHLMMHSSGVLVSVYGRRKAPFGQRVMLSDDNGESWSTDYVLRDDSPVDDTGYPASVELKDGKILTVYYQRKSKEENASILYTIWEIVK